MPRITTELVVVPTYIADPAAETELLRGLLKRRRSRQEMSSDAVTPEPDAQTLAPSQQKEKKIVVLVDTITDIPGGTSEEGDS